MTATILPFPALAAAARWTDRDLRDLTAECKRALVATRLGVLQLRRVGPPADPMYTIGFVHDLEPDQACALLMMVGATLPPAD